MNKQIEELELRLRSYLPLGDGSLWSQSSKDMAEAAKIIAELAKQSEPVGFVMKGEPEYGPTVHFPSGFPSVGSKLFTNPLPQADLVAEVERLNGDLDSQAQFIAEGVEQRNKLRQQLSAAQAELADREGMVCGDCNDTGWLENRVEGRHPCTCMTEAEPYQLLEQQLKAAQADNDELVKVLEELSCLGNGNSYGNSHGNVIAQKAIAAHKARQGKEQQ